MLQLTWCMAVSVYPLTMAPAIAGWTNRSSMILAGGQLLTSTVLHACIAKTLPIPRRWQKTFIRENIVLSVLLGLYLAPLLVRVATARFSDQATWTEAFCGDGVFEKTYYILSPLIYVLIFIIQYGYMHWRKLKYQIATLVVDQRKANEILTPVGHRSKPDGRGCCKYCPWNTLRWDTKPGYRGWEWMRTPVCVPRGRMEFFCDGVWVISICLVLVEIVPVLPRTSFQAPSTPFRNPEQNKSLESLCAEVSIFWIDPEEMEKAACNTTHRMCSTKAHHLVMCAETKGIPVPWCDCDQTQFDAGKHPCVPSAVDFIKEESFSVDSAVWYVPRTIYMQHIHTGCPVEAYTPTSHTNLHICDTDQVF